MLWKKKVSGAILKQMGKIKREEMINDRKIILKLVEIKEQFVLMEIFYIKNKLFFYPLFSLHIILIITIGYTYTLQYHNQWLC